jgi:hypothetical protein
MSNPFDYLNAINYTKKDLMTGSANDELAEDGYNPFVVNKGLSYFPDTILYSNEMNTRPQIDNKLQFHYLINSIRPKKRYSKWHKRNANNDLEAIQQYYQCNYTKAEQALKVLTGEQIECIKQRLQSCEE